MSAAGGFVPSGGIIASGQGFGPSSSSPLVVAPNPMASVTCDAIAGVYVPQSNAEVATWLAAAGVAGGTIALAAWGFQDAAGATIVDILNNAIPLTVGGTAPTFQVQPTNAAQVTAANPTGQITSGYCVSVADAANTTITSTSASLPDISTTDFLVILYRYLNTIPGANKNVMAFGTTNRARLELASTPALQSKGPTATVAGIGSPLSRLQPFVLDFNRGGGAVNCYSLTEAIAGTFETACNGKALTLGNSAATCAGGHLRYAIAFSGANAAAVRAKLRNCIQMLGWKETW